MRRRLRPLYLLQWLTLVLALVTAAGTLTLWTRSQNAIDTIHHVQCLAKADRQRAVAAGRAFLREHPDGTADFSRQQIVQSIQQNQASLANLAAVQCP